MSTHRFSSLLAELEQEPPAGPPSAPIDGMAILSAASLSCLTKEQIEAAQQLHRIAFERAMQSLAPPPCPRGLFDSLN